MVDVEGLQKFKRRLTDQCTVCPVEEVRNVEWLLRESLSKILKVENEQFSSIFEEYPDLKFYPTVNDIEKAIHSRETFGVTTNFKSYKLFTCPVLLGGKMYQLITSGCEYVDKDSWDLTNWSAPPCLFCNSNLTITCVIVRGRIYTLSQLAWTDYNRVVYIKKEGFLLYRKKPLTQMKEYEYPILQDFKGMTESLSTCFGNKKMFHAGFIFTSMLKQTISDINKLFDKPKKNVLIRQLIKIQRKRINTGAVDCIIGKNTLFNFPESNKSILSKTYNMNNVGRYKVINKIDYTTVCKSLQIDTLTTKYSKKIAIDLQKADIGFICLVASSEQSPGTTSLETALGCIISSENDCIPVHTLLYELNKRTIDLKEIRVKTDCDLKDKRWLYVIVNQSLYKHTLILSKSSDFIHWILKLRQDLKAISPFVEVYPVSERLYCIYSLHLTLYKIFHDGLPYSAMETTDLFIEMISENYNYHGGSALLIPNLNCNNLVRNTMIIHSIKNCISGHTDSKLKNEVYLLNKYELIKGVPFYCIKGNILIFPMEFNIEDAVMVNAESRELFSICHKMTLPLQLENPHFIKILIETFPVGIKPFMVIAKFTCDRIVHIGKHLSTSTDPFNKDVTNLIFTPNPDLIKEKDLILNEARITQSNENQIYIDFQINYIQEVVPGTKVFVFNGAQKSVIGCIVPKENIPILHNSPNLEDISNINVDLIQNPYSLKRLSMNFLYTPEHFKFFNDCFSVSAIDRLNVLLGKKDYYVSDPKTGRFYVDIYGSPVKAILYEGYIGIMRQNPYALIHSADIDNTSINTITGQPEVRYQQSQNNNFNSHPYGIGDTERDVATGLSINHFIEERYDLSDACPVVLENSDHEKVCVPGSKSLKRVLDNLALTGVEFDFLIKHIETDF